MSPIYSHLTLEYEGRVHHVTIFREFLNISQIARIVDVDEHRWLNKYGSQLSKNFNGIFTVTDHNSYNDVFDTYLSLTFAPDFLYWCHKDFARQYEDHVERDKQKLKLTQAYVDCDYYKRKSNLLRDKVSALERALREYL